MQCKRWSTLLLLGWIIVSSFGCKPPDTLEHKIFRLKPGLTHANPIKRAETVEKLGKLGARVLPILTRVLHQEKNEDVQVSVVRALGNLGTKALPTASLLQRYLTLNPTQSKLPIASARALGQMKAASAGKALAKLLFLRTPVEPSLLSQSEKRAVAYALLQLGVEAAPALKKVLQHPHPTMRALMAQMLGGYGIKGIVFVPALSETLYDKNPVVQHRALKAINKLLQASLTQLKHSKGAIPQFPYQWITALAQLQTPLQHLAKRQPRIQKQSLIVQRLSQDLLPGLLLHVVYEFKRTSIRRYRKAQKALLELRQIPFLGERKNAMNEALHRLLQNPERQVLQRIQTFLNQHIQRHSTLQGMLLDTLTKVDTRTRKTIQHGLSTQASATLAHLQQLREKYEKDKSTKLNSLFELASSVAPLGLEYLELTRLALSNSEGSFRWSFYNSKLNRVFTKSSDSGLPILIGWLYDKNGAVRKRAIKLIARMGVMAQQAAPALLGLYPLAPYDVTRALFAIGPTASEELTQLLPFMSTRQQLKALHILPQNARALKKALPKILPLLNAYDKKVKHRTATLFHHASLFYPKQVHQLLSKSLSKDKTRTQRQLQRNILKVFQRIGSKALKQKPNLLHTLRHMLNKSKLKTRLVTIQTIGLLGPAAKSLEKPLLGMLKNRLLSFHKTKAPSTLPAIPADMPKERLIQAKQKHAKELTYILEALLQIQASQPQLFQWVKELTIIPPANSRQCHAILGLMGRAIRSSPKLYLPFLFNRSKLHRTYFCKSMSHLSMGPVLAQYIAKVGEEALPSLQKALYHQVRSLRWVAAESIRLMGKTGSPALAILPQRLQKEKSPHIKWTLWRTLRGLSSKHPLLPKMLLRFLQTQEVWLLTRALQYIPEYPSHTAQYLPHLRKILVGKIPKLSLHSLEHFQTKPKLRFHASEAIRASLQKRPQHLPFVLQLLQSNNTHLQKYALLLLRTMGSHTAPIAKAATTELWKRYRKKKNKDLEILEVIMALNQSPKEATKELQKLAKNHSYKGKRASRLLLSMNPSSHVNMKRIIQIYCSKRPFGISKSNLSWSEKQLLRVGPKVLPLLFSRLLKPNQCKNLRKLRRFVLSKTFKPTTFLTKTLTGTNSAEAKKLALKLLMKQEEKGLSTLSRLQPVLFGLYKVYPSLRPSILRVFAQIKPLTNPIKQLILNAFDIIQKRKFNKKLTPSHAYIQATLAALTSHKLHNGKGVLRYLLSNVHDDKVQGTVYRALGPFVPGHPDILQQLLKELTRKNNPFTQQIQKALIQYWRPTQERLKQELFEEHPKRRILAANILAKTFHSTKALKYLYPSAMNDPDKHVQYTILRLIPKLSLSEQQAFFLMTRLTFDAKTHSRILHVFEKDYLKELFTHIHNPLLLQQATRFILKNGPSRFFQLSIRKVTKKGANGLFRQIFHFAQTKAGKSYTRYHMTQEPWCTHAFTKQLLSTLQKLPKAHSARLPFHVEMLHKATQCHRYICRSCNQKTFTKQLLKVQLTLPTPPRFTKWYPNCVHCLSSFRRFQETGPTEAFMKAMYRARFGFAPYGF